MRYALVTVALFAATVGMTTRTPRAARTALTSQIDHDTRLFRCGEDETIAAGIPVAVASVALAGDGRQFVPCPGGPHAATHRESRELAVLLTALRSDDPALRRAALLAMGRAGLNPIRPPTRPEVAPGRGGQLDHADPAVRLAAIAGLTIAVDGVTREPTTIDAPAAAAGGQPDVDAIQAARGHFQARLEVEQDDVVVGALLEAMGQLAYQTNAERDSIEAVLASRVQADGSPYRLLGAVKGLEALIRRGGRRPVAAATIESLRAVVGHGSRNTPFDPDADVYARARRLAMLALTAARDDDAATIVAASRDRDWQVRRLATARLNGAVPELAAPLAAALDDQVFQVRIEAMRVAGRAVASTKQCGPLVAALADREPAVVMAAIDAMPADCVEADDVLARLGALALRLSLAQDSRSWHVPARALAALARIAPERAAPMLDGAAGHGVWQVRAAAAGVAAATRGEAAAMRLADDRDANVRGAALQALTRLGSPARFAAAERALQSDDFGLVRTAAGVFRDAPDKQAAASALLSTLKRLTDGRADTSRDPRVAILEQLATLMEPSQVASLAPFAADVDPRVARAARDAIARLSNSIDEPSSNAWRRYPYQPPIETLANAPRRATLTLEPGGIVEIELFTDDALVSVAHFAQLVRARYYDGLTLHRVAPNFVIQGGSPGANEYSGVPRYWRDEIGRPNLRGTLGLSTRGRDTGDGQFFVNLVDNPRLDQEYTVFGRVVSGMAVIDRVLEGARIASISVR